MTYRLIHYYIRIFYRRLRLQKKFIYNSARVLTRLLPTRLDKSSIIQANYTNPSIQIPKKLGYLQFSIQHAPELSNVIQDCTKLFNEKRKHYDQDFFIRNPNKRFLLTIDIDNNLLSIPSIRELLTSEIIQQGISNYFQSSYILSTVRLWWSPASDPMDFFTKSQLYHVDEEDLSQIKLLININDISAEHGPFTFLNAIDSSKVISKYKVGKKKFTDEEVASSQSSIKTTSLIGPSGSAAFVDTSRCLHYGSRGNKHDRLLLMAQFLRTDAPLLQQSLSLQVI